MFANLQNIGDFKENVKSSLSTKSQPSQSRKGLKSRTLNNFTDNPVTNISKKNTFETKPAACKFVLEKEKKRSLEEKENYEPKIKEVKEMKAVSCEDSGNWSDIEEMPIYPEPDDDYEDILPKWERIQKADIDALFRPICLTKYIETHDRLPSPTLELKCIDFPDFSPVPEIKMALYDDTPLHDIPL